MHAAGEMLKSRGRDRRKIIFLISDGNNSRTNEHTLDQTLQLLQKSDVSVYSIPVGHALGQKESSRLERYATSTGGDTFYAGKDRGLDTLTLRSPSRRAISTPSRFSRKIPIAARIFTASKCACAAPTST